MSAFMVYYLFLMSHTIGAGTGNGDGIVTSSSLKVEVVQELLNEVAGM